MGISFGNSEASFASGFTSKITNINKIEYLIREGRACITTYF